jgi:hypothetical protein
VVGFSSAADDGFGAASAYGVIIAGMVVLVASFVHYLTTKRNAIIPAVRHCQTTRLILANDEDSDNDLFRYWLLLQLFHADAYQLSSTTVLPGRELFYRLRD